MRHNTSFPFPEHRRVLGAWLSAVGAAFLTVSVTMPGHAQPFRQEVRNDLRRCSANEGPAVYVTLDGLKSSTGMVRVQAYRGTAADWLQKGRWLTRIEVPAKAGSMAFCVPVPSPGTYAIAVRHDANGSGKTDLRTDGGGMSNNPSINIFNLGRPSVSRTAFTVGNGVKSIRIQMKYM